MVRMIETQEGRAGEGRTIAMRENTLKGQIPKRATRPDLV
jgi:hypothetical protein